MSGDKELIWVEKEFAKKYQKIESDDAKLKMLDDYLVNATASVKEEYKECLTILSEEAQIFTGITLKTKQVFGEALQKVLDSSFEVWEKFDTQRPSINKKVQLIVKDLEPLEEKLTAITNLIAKINTYGFDRLHESVSRISNLDGNSMKMLEFLIDNYYKKEEES